jgi:hypothetical protein
MDELRNARFSSEPPTKVAARERFLSTMLKLPRMTRPRRKRPATERKSLEVLNSLEKDVLPLYKGLCPPASNLSIVCLEGGSPLFDETLFLLRIGLVRQPFPGSLDPNRFGDLRRRFDNWVIEYKVACEWVREYAVDTLEKWTYAGTPEKLEWVFDSPSHGVGSTNEPILIFAPWSYKGESAKEHRARIEAKLKKHYEDATEKAKAKAEPIGHEHPQKAHYEWLVDIQVNDRKVLHVAEENITDHRGVSRAIKSLAKYIDLPLRPLQRGPSRKA